MNVPTVLAALVLVLPLGCAVEVDSGPTEANGDDAPALAVPVHQEPRGWRACVFEGAPIGETLKPAGTHCLTDDGADGVCRLNECRIPCELEANDCPDGTVCQADKLTDLVICW